MGEQFSKAARSSKIDYDEYWLVTPESPQIREGMLTGLAGAPKPVRALSLDELAAALSVSSSTTQSEIPTKIAFLKDQLPTGLDIQSRSAEELEQLLCLGQNVDRVIVVFSDLVKFTTIVERAEPSGLNDFLRDYYRLARAKIRDHDGVLDKFMGDGVLAVFNYPSGIANPFTRAVRYSGALIREGRQLLDDFIQSCDREFDTGTRIAITCGPVRPIDVGESMPQVSFIGRPVNLAARLQHKAETDGIIMSRIAFTGLRNENEALAASLNASDQSFPPNTFAGIEDEIRTQKISTNNARIIT
jgi:class 3 adenylate cyclase